LALSVTDIGVKLVKALLPKIRSRNGVSIPNENKLKTMDKKIKRAYQPI
jgi:hypothetical protein